MQMIHRGRSQLDSPSPRRSRYHDTPPRHRQSSSRYSTPPQRKLRSMSNSPPRRSAWDSPRTIRYDIDYPDGGQAVTFYHPDLDSPINHDRYPEGTLITERCGTQEGYGITIPESPFPNDTTSRAAQANGTSTFVAEAFD